MLITELYHFNHPYCLNGNQGIDLFAASIIIIVTGIYDSRWHVSSRLRLPAISRIYTCCQKFSPKICDDRFNFMQSTEYSLLLKSVSRYLTMPIVYHSISAKYRICGLILISPRFFLYETHWNKQTEKTFYLCFVYVDLIFPSTRFSTIIVAV